MRVVGLLLFLAVFLVPATGCIEADVGDGILLCSTDPSRPCPRNYFCADNGYCYHNGDKPYERPDASTPQQSFDLAQPTNPDDMAMSSSPFDFAGVTFDFAGQGGD